MALIDLPQEKWSGVTGRQVILKRDFAVIEQAVVEGFDLAGLPALEYAGPAQVKVRATDACRARVMLNGFPSPIHPGLWVDGGLADGRYRESAGPITLDLGQAAQRWGQEKAEQWYCIYAVAAATDVLFSLKAMPVMRVAAVSGQLISLANNGNTGGIGYGLAADELAQAKLLVLSGAARGQARVITGNNSDNDAGGTITYDGGALALAPGDWLIVLPRTNFRYLGMVWNDAAGDLTPFWQEGRSCSYPVPRQLASGPLNGFTRVDLGLAAPPTARYLYGFAAAVNGAEVRLAFSLNGSTPHLVLHAPAPATPLAGLRGALPFCCRVGEGHALFLDNGNNPQQVVHLSGWGE